MDDIEQRFREVQDNNEIANDYAENPLAVKPGGSDAREVLPIALLVMVLSFVAFTGISVAKLIGWY